jgi:hypothetical protein
MVREVVAAEVRISRAVASAAWCGEVREHAGVGVGGEHDAGMPELVGNGLQISTG